MVLVALPDPIAALAARLRSFSEITTLVSTDSGYTGDATPVQKSRPRISTEAQDFWDLPAEAILIRKRPGPPPDRDGRQRVSRIELWFFGYGGTAKRVSRQERAAFTVWRTVQPALCPGHGESTRFVEAHCIVTGIEEEADPYPYDPERDLGWRVVVWPIMVRWLEQAAS